MPAFETLRDDASKIEHLIVCIRALVRSTFTTLGAGVSNRDTGLVEEIFPGVPNTDIGIKKMLLVQRRTNERVKDIAAEERRYMKTPGATRNGMDDHIAEWAERNPLFTEKDLKFLGGAEGPPGQPKTGGPGKAIPGETMDEGYLYKGGDLRDRRNWEKRSEVAGALNG